MRFAIISTLVLVLLSGVAVAGPLAEDPNALFYDGTLWRGTTVMKLYTMDANVDWCVYAPGQFSYPGLGYTPTSGEFVYAYQVFVEPESEVFTFSVGLDVSNKANNIGTFLLSGGAEPDSSVIHGTPPFEEAVWEWFDPGLQPGSKSVGLAFSSVNAPKFYGGNVMNSGGGAGGDVPSPSDVIPEPVTLGLLLVGAIVGGLRRNRHQ